MMMDEIKFGGSDHIIHQCGSCGVFHTIPKVMYENCFRLGGFWCCPNGHRRGWENGAEKTEIETLRRERDRLKQNTARLEDAILAEQRRSATAEEKVKVIQRRAVAGVCPCCNRTFSNVQRHMATKHKNVVPLAQKTNA
jgi:hypothetical protein